MYVCRECRRASRSALIGTNRDVVACGGCGSGRIEVLE